MMSHKCLGGNSRSLMKISVLFCCFVKNWKNLMKSQLRLPVFCWVLNQEPYTYNSWVSLTTKFCSMMFATQVCVCVVILWYVTGCSYVGKLYITDESASFVFSTNSEVSRNRISWGWHLQHLFRLALEPTCPLVDLQWVTGPFSGWGVGRGAWRWPSTPT